MEQEEIEKYSKAERYLIIIWTLFQFDKVILSQVVSVPLGISKGQQQNNPCEVFLGGYFIFLSISNILLGTYLFSQPNTPVFQEITSGTQFPPNTFML